MKLKAIYFMANGNVMAFDDNEDQVPELQKNQVRAVVLLAQNLGYDLSNTKIMIGDREAELIFEDGKPVNYIIGKYHY